MNLFAVTIIILVLYYEIIEIISCPVKCICTNKEQHVKCQNQDLNSIPLYLPTNVVTLDLSKNVFYNLSSRAFSSLTSLKNLWLNHCQIKYIANDAFEGLDKLTHLFLTNNDIEQLHENVFKTNYGLVNLYLTKNKFRNIPPLLSKSLVRVNLDSNQISDAFVPQSFRSNTALRTLILTDNRISSLKESVFTNLGTIGIQSLMLKMNNLDHIDPGAFRPIRTSLQNLRLERNRLLSSKQLQAALHAFSGGSSLVFLDIRQTGLTNISQTFFAPFQGSSLRHLDIGDNSQLSDIHEDAFNNLDKLQLLIADKCSISSPSIKFNAISALKEVRLSHNKFEKCPYLLPQSVQIVDLSYNEIKQLLKNDLKGLSSLKSLKLDNNAISNIEEGSFSDLINLSYLDLSHNDIVTLQPRIFSSMPDLAVLDLRQQNICLKNIAADSFFLPSLITLNLSRNCIDSSSLDSSLFKNCPSLTNLSIVSNSIDFLGEKVFDGCKNLSFLYLSHNKLRGWSPRTFVGLKTTLMDIDLSFNQLQWLSTIDSDKNYLPPYFTKLQTVSLESNRWNCTCTNIQWLLAHKDFLRDSDVIKCENPNKMNGRKLFDLNEMKDCHVQTIKPGEKIQDHQENRKGIIYSVISVVLTTLLIIGLFLFRRQLRRSFRRINKYFRKHPYQQLSNDNSSEPRLFVNPLVDDAMLDLSGNSLVMNDSVLLNPSHQDIVPAWLDLVKGSSYDSSYDIVFLSTQINIDCGSLKVEIIHNLEDLKCKEAAYHCRMFVVDYPMVDTDILKVIVGEREGAAFDQEYLKESYLFHSIDLDDSHIDEINELIGEANVKEYCLSDIVSSFYVLF